MTRRSNRSSWARALALGAALALAPGLAACGGSDDGDGPAANVAEEQRGGERGAAGERDASNGTAAGTAEQEIRAAYRRFTDAMSAKDARGACAMLTPEARKATGAGISCVKRFESILKDTQPADEKAYLSKLEIDGDEAVAGAKTKTSDVYTVTFSKRAGEWRISGDEE